MNIRKNSGAKSKEKEATVLLLENIESYKFILLNPGPHLTLKVFRHL